MGLQFMFYVGESPANVVGSRILEAQNDSLGQLVPAPAAHEYLFIRNFATNSLAQEPAARRPGRRQTANDDEGRAILLDLVEDFGKKYIAREDLELEFPRVEVFLEHLQGQFILRVCWHAKESQRGSMVIRL